MFMNLGEKVFSKILTIGSSYVQKNVYITTKWGLFQECKAGSVF